MNVLEGIKARADAARAPCIAYWLMVFACLMIHLFPVAEIAGDSGLRNNNTYAVTLSEDDWVPPASIDEIPILRRAPAFAPRNYFAAAIQSVIITAAGQIVRPFDARGPPVPA